MVNIVCCYWGNWCEGYRDHYIIRLFSGIRRNTTVKFNFYCLTDKVNDVSRSLPFINVLPLESPSWMFNFPKLCVYNPAYGFIDQTIVFDLDDIIIGNIDDILSYSGEFCTRESFDEPGQIGGDVISFNPEYCENIWTYFKTSYRLMEKKYKGSERKFLRAFHNNKVDMWQQFIPNSFLSFKFHVRKGLDKITNCKVLSFHGQPRPHEVPEIWDNYGGI